MRKEYPKRHQVPHQHPPLWPHSWQVVNQEVRATPDLSPGGGSLEPLLAEHTLHESGAEEWPCLRVQGPDFWGHQDRDHFQVPQSFICWRPARPYQHQEEMVLNPKPSFSLFINTRLFCPYLILELKNYELCNSVTPPFNKHLMKTSIFNKCIWLFTWKFLVIIISDDEQK